MHGHVTTGSMSRPWQGHFGGRGAASAVLAALLLHLPLAPGNEIQTKVIAQESACTGALNTITITLQVRPTDALCM